MKSKHIITGVGMLFCLMFFDVPDAAGQSRDYEVQRQEMEDIHKGHCNHVTHPFYVRYCWERKIRNGGKNLRYAQLSQMSLRWADLTGAQLVHADLTEAELMGANMTGAQLDFANLKGASLTGANLTNASLDGAILTGAIVSRSKTKGIDFEYWKNRGAIVRD